MKRIKFFFFLALLALPLSAAAQEQRASLCCRCTKTGAAQSFCALVFGVPECGRYRETVDFTGLTQEEKALAEGYTCTTGPENCAVAPASGGSSQNAAAFCPREATPLAQAIRSLAPPPTNEPPGDAPPPPPVIPALNIPIPGLHFGTITNENGRISVPFLGQYISAVYRYAITLALILAVIMVVYGGFLYMVGSVAGAHDKGKKIILDAIAGLILLMGAYVVLKTVNPKLVALDALSVSSVDGIALESAYLEETGSMGPGSEDGEPSATVEPGQYRSAMEQVCGRKDGYSLRTLAERQERLKNIVTTWEQIGARQGGAVYVWGGRESCTGFEHDANWIFNGIRKHAANSFERDYPGIFTPACLQHLQESTRTESAALSPCTAQEMINAYAATPVARARAAGMMCADCGVFTRAIFNCFGGSTGYNATRSDPSKNCARDQLSPPLQGGDDDGAQHAYPADPRFAFRLWFGDLTHSNLSRTAKLAEVRRRVDAVKNNLKFGDVIYWRKLGNLTGGRYHWGGNNAHVYTYTGGLNPPLPFEILEMGGGMSSGVYHSGSEAAKRNLNISYSTSAVRSTRNGSGIAYISSGVPDCLFATHMLDPNVIPPR